MSKSLPNLRLNSPITSKVIGQNVAKVRKERKVSQLSLSLDMGYKSVSVVSFAEISLKGAHFNYCSLTSNIYDFKCAINRAII
ncbi:hypothetical protein [Campylobacter devanensis]|uniref:hypothetical protein n=1 Tax=Campylobacter devanensis TaxID=3161138 RepID=UPI001F2ACE2E|nr:hypothetical protein [Campylobacter sp. P0132]